MHDSPSEMLESLHLRQTWHRVVAIANHHCLEETSGRFSGLKMLDGNIKSIFITSPSSDSFYHCPQVNVSIEVIIGVQPRRPYTFAQNPSTLWQFEVAFEN